MSKEEKIQKALGTLEYFYTYITRPQLSLFNKTYITRIFRRDLAEYLIIFSAVYFDQVIEVIKPRITCFKVTGPLEIWIEEVLLAWGWEETSYEEIVND